MTDDLAFLALPLLQGSYHGHPLIDALCADVRRNYTSEELTRAENQLQANAHFTYKKPKDSELEYTNRNLVKAMNIICDCATREWLTVIQASAAVLDEKLYLMSQNSNPGCMKDDHVGVVASQVKDIFAGPLEACAQAVSASGSFAMQQVSLGVPRDQVLLPFVLSFSDSLQFGAAYVIDSNFPCAAMLTPPLSLLSWESRSEICRWLLALGRFCDRQVALLRDLPKQLKPLRQCTLNFETLFLKHMAPASSGHSMIRAVRNSVCHLMQIFQLLHLHAECRSFVVFPLGTMGLPKAEDDKFRAAVCNALVADHHPQEKEVVSSLPTGWPIVIYPRLKSPEWQCAALVPDLYRHRASFVAQLTAMLNHVAEAGVIHLDVRLANIMVKLPLVSSSSSSSSLRLQLKIIDWNESVRLGHPVAPSLLAAYERDPEQRYPVDQPTATVAYHAFFIARIDKLLREREAKVASAPVLSDQVLEGSAGGDSLSGVGIDAAGDNEARVLEDCNAKQSNAKQSNTKEGNTEQRDSEEGNAGQNEAKDIDSEQSDAKEGNAADVRVAKRRRKA